MASFLFLYGWQGSEPEHWQRRSAAALADRGHDVRFPELPDPDLPVLGRWLERLEEELAAVDPAETTVLAHSMGCYLWLHHALQAQAPVDRVLLVAPPAPTVGETIEELRDLAPPHPDATTAARAARSTELVYGDDDPYWPGGGAAELASALRIPAYLIPSGGHVNVAAGYGDWPELLAWCERTGSF